MSYGDIDTLEVYLQNLQVADHVKAAEAWLTEYKKDPRCIPDFLAILETRPNVSVRAQAALSLTKSLKGFKHLNPVAQAVVQQKLIERLTSETERIVLTALCACTARVYKAVLKLGRDWNADIFQLITQLAAAPDAKHRELNFELVEHLTENAPQIMMSQVQQFCQLYAVGAQDPEEKVQIQCFRAMTIMVEQFNESPEDENIMYFKEVLPFVLTSINAFLAANQEGPIPDGLELFSVCSASQHDLFNENISSLLEILVNILINSQEESIMNSAGETFRSLVINRPKLIGKQNLVGPILEQLVGRLAVVPGSAVGSIFNFNASVANKDEDDDDDEDINVATARMIQECIDSMAIHIPKKYFVEPALQLCSMCLNDEHAPDRRKAGCAVLGVITEGTAESLRHILDQVLPIVLERCKDPDQNVRECACFALGQMSEHCQPQILLYHENIIPAILENFDSTEVAVQITTAYVIETFCEPLQAATLEKYLGAILGKLGALLTSPNVGLVETALSALASVSVASEDKFIPYMSDVIQFLTPFMQNEEEKYFNVRGRALECLGHIAIAVGDVQYEPYFIPSLQNAMAVLNSTDEALDGLKEYSYIFIANTAKAMKKHYTPLLDQIVPLLIRAAAEEESEPYEDGEDDDGIENVLVTVHDGFIANKKASLTALGALAEFTGGDFLPYLKDYMTLLFMDEGPLESYHEVLRAEASSVLFQCVAVVSENMMPQWKPQKGQAIELPQDVTSTAQQIIGKYLYLISNDLDRHTVHASIQGLEETIKLLGASCLIYKDMDVQVITGAICNTLAEKLPCQKAVEKDDEDSDHDNIIMDACCDLVGTLSKQVGESFLPYFQLIHQQLFKYLGRTDHEDRAMAIGCYGEIIEEVGAPSAPYFADVYPYLEKGVADPIESVRRNSAYCIAASVESLGANFTAEHFNRFLQLLAPLCQRSARNVGDKEDIRGGDVDNAIAAVFRIAAKYPEHVPFDAFLPPILASLPIQCDPQEGKKIYEALFGYIAACEANTMQQLSQVLTVFAKVIGPDSQDYAETRRYVQETFAMAYNTPEIRTHFDAAFAAMEAPYVQILQGAIA